MFRASEHMWLLCLGQAARDLLSAKEPTASHHGFRQSPLELRVLVRS